MHFLQLAFGVHMLVHWSVAAVMTALDWDNVKHRVDEVVTAVKASLFNQFCVTLPTSLLAARCLKWREPVLSSNAVTLVGYLVVEEVLFYTAHRLFHVPPLYGRFHKQHHLWINPTAVAALDDHPLDHLLTNVVPIMLGPWLFGTQPWLMAIWIALATANSLKAHMYSKGHLLHHRRVTCNYGILTLMDRVFGTYVSP